MDDLTARPPTPALAGLVTRIDGFDLRPSADHAGMPSGALTLIVPLGAPLWVSGPVRGPGEDLLTRPTSHVGIISGLHSQAVTVHARGRQAGIQLDLTPAGARALLGVPAAELSNRVIAPDHVLELDQLTDRLCSVTDWQQRFDLLERWLLSHLDDGAKSARDRSPETWEAWRLLARSRGRLPIDSVAQRVGWSRRHLTNRFAAEFGHPPKLVARLMRFAHSRQRLADPDARLATVAARCGFADQAHLTREWRSIAGSTPTAWRLAEGITPVSSQTFKTRDAAARQDRPHERTRLHPARHGPKGSQHLARDHQQ